jgi:hypothetical protein
MLNMIDIVSVNNNTPNTYENNGGLAQLGERLHGMQKVRGSTPLSSTNIMYLKYQDIMGNYW